MKILKLALFLLFTVAVSACAPISQALGQLSPSVSASNPQQPSAVQWNLVSFTTGGKQIPVLSSNPISLEFGANSSVSGSTGCNSYSGTYVVQGDKMTFGQMTQTLRACAAPEAMQQEQRYLRALAASGSYVVSGSQLTLSYNGTDTLTFVKAGAGAPAPMPTIAPQGGAPTAVPVPAVAWKRQHFGNFWNVAFPQNWTVNDDGAQQGAIELQGPYGSDTYQIGITYPIGIDATSLEAWVQQQVGAIPQPEQANVQVKDITVAGAPAKLVLNMPTADAKERTHNVYIWKAGDVNQRLIIIAQVDDQPFDAQAMQKLLNDFLFQIH